MNATKEFGGYFGLDLPDHGDAFPGMLPFQSARAALRAIFATNRISQVWIPAYVCDSVFASAEEAGVKYVMYHLDDDLYPIDLPANIPQGNALLYVNYFGLKQDIVHRLLQDYPADRIIVDNSQALFASPTAALASVYSPRKFAGLPDGGLLACSADLGIRLPDREDEGSFERMRFMMLRTAHSAREGYPAFNVARQSLRGLPPLSMSRMTRRLMRSIDWPALASARKRNFAIMHDQLRAYNQMTWRTDAESVPLCYPLMLTANMDTVRLRNSLADENIFVPVYWPDALERAPASGITTRLLHQTLFLPIDQRIGAEECAAIARRIGELLEQADRFAAYS